jgi:hypothetical protein
MKASRHTSLGIRLAGLLVSLTLASCAAPTDGEETASSEQALVTFQVVETGAWTAGGGLHATYGKTILVTSSAPLAPETVMRAIYKNNATGPLGLCPSCTSTTPEWQQNNGGVIDATGVVPGGLWAPGPFKGHARAWLDTPTQGVLQMENLTDGLYGTITAHAISPTEVEVDESGYSSGPFAGTFAGGHNQYFDLRSAIERQLH